MTMFFVYALLLSLAYMESDGNAVVEQNAAAMESSRSSNSVETDPNTLDEFFISKVCNFATLQKVFEAPEKTPEATLMMAIRLVRACNGQAIKSHRPEFQIDPNAFKCSEHSKEDKGTLKDYEKECRNGSAVGIGGFKAELKCNGILKTCQCRMYFSAKDKILDPIVKDRGFNRPGVIGKDQDGMNTCKCELNADEKDEFSNFNKHMLGRSATILRLLNYHYKVTSTCCKP